MEEVWAGSQGMREEGMDKKGAGSLLSHKLPLLPGEGWGEGIKSG